LRISLIHALALFAFAGLSLAALVSGSPLWRQALFLLIAAALFLSALAALAWSGDERRWFAIGFVLAGGLAFWNAGERNSTLRRLPLLDWTAEFFHLRHIDRVATPLANGELAFRRESGQMLVRDSTGGIRSMRGAEAASLGLAIGNLQPYRSELEFQSIAELVATLLLAYLGGVAGMLVRRARRAPAMPVNDAGDA
jgi:hypothetical protein